MRGDSAPPVKTANKVTTTTNIVAMPIVFSHSLVPVERLLEVLA
jgi:hypothetical protein